MEDSIEIEHVFLYVCVFVREFNRKFQAYLNMYLTISANAHLTGVRNRVW